MIRLASVIRHRRRRPAAAAATATASHFRAINIDRNSNDDNDSEITNTPHEWFYDILTRSSMCLVETDQMTARITSVI